MRAPTVIDPPGNRITFGEPLDKRPE